MEKLAKIYYETCNVSFDSKTRRKISKQKKCTALRKTLVHSVSSSAGKHGGKTGDEEDGQPLEQSESTESTDSDLSGGKQLQSLDLDKQGDEDEDNADIYEDYFDNVLRSKDREMARNRWGDLDSVGQCPADIEDVMFENEELFELNGHRFHIHTMSHFVLQLLARCECPSRLHKYVKLNIGLIGRSRETENQNRCATRIKTSTTTESNRIRYFTLYSIVALTVPETVDTFAQSSSTTGCILNSKSF